LTQIAPYGWNRSSTCSLITLASLVVSIEGTVQQYNNKTYFVISMEDSEEEDLLGQFEAAHHFIGPSGLLSYRMKRTDDGIFKQTLTLQLEQCSYIAKVRVSTFAAFACLAK
jgi:hypothetical protein